MKPFANNDRVYVPFYTNKVCVVKEVFNLSKNACILEVVIDKEDSFDNTTVIISVNKHGCIGASDKCGKVLFHANYQNCTALEALYGFSFENPHAYIQATIKLPKPYKGDIKQGTTVYVATPTSLDKVTPLVWDNLSLRRYLKDTGQIYLKEKDAIEASDAILGALGEEK